MVGDECMKALKIYVCLTCPIITLCLIFNILGITTFSYTGFAVDSCGIVFIGKDSIIEKYFDGKKIAELDPKTSRGYAFTIQDPLFIRWILMAKSSDEKLILKQRCLMVYKNKKNFL